MKKLLPIIAGILIVVVVIAGFIIKGKGGSQSSPTEEETSIPAIPESQWPAISLTPTEKSGVSGSLGHWLDFKVEKINVPGAVAMDYLLTYKTAEGVGQGIPGPLGGVKLSGNSFEIKLLMGSESSGKFRYDAGVEQGTMTITFRDSKGKAIGRLASDFHLQTGVAELTSVDGLFKYTLDKVPKNVYFVTMKTYAQPDTASVVWQGGYGVFASDGNPHPGKIASQ